MISTACRAPPSSRFSGRSVVAAALSQPVKRSSHYTPAHSLLQPPLYDHGSSATLLEDIALRLILPTTPNVKVQVKSGFDRQTAFLHNVWCNVSAAQSSLCPTAPNVRLFISPVCKNTFLNPLYTRGQISNITDGLHVTSATPPYISSPIMFDIVC